MRRGAGVSWTWDMDMPDLPVIETEDTHKIGRKGAWRPRAELRDGWLEGSRETTCTLCGHRRTHFRTPVNCQEQGRC